MAYLTRRSVLRGSIALGASRVLAFTHVARAAANHRHHVVRAGVRADEDVSLRKAVADYEKASGNKIELSIIPFAPERQKIVSAITSGVVPDILDSNPLEILQIYGWQDKWVDVSDVVETQKAQFSENALQSIRAYNAVTKKHGVYGVPLRAAVAPCHIWRPMVEKAGFKIEDIPKTWDAHFDSSRKCRIACASRASARVYGLGFQGNVQRGRSLQPLHGVSRGLWWPETSSPRTGSCHPRRPEGQGGRDQAAAYLGGAYRDGYVPPSAINLERRG